MKDNTNDLSRHYDLYKTILETGKDMITVCDMDLTLIYVSSSVKDLLGYDSEETKSMVNLGKRSDLTSIIAPGSVVTFSETVRKWIKEYAKRDASERGFPMELELNSHGRYQRLYFNTTRG